MKMSEQIPKTWELNPKTVCYYSHTLKDFVDEYGQKTAKTMMNKAERILERNLIQYDGDNTFKILPIEGYNTRTYHLRKIRKKGAVTEQFECNCQGYQTKIKKGEKPGCSHTLALALYFKMGGRS